MKGTVVSAWIQSCRNLFGDDIVNEALKAHDLADDRVFSPLEDVSDSVATGIVDYIGNGVGKNGRETIGKKQKKRIEMR